MKTDEDFRTRARAVRLAARDHLQAIRRERLSRRGPAPVPERPAPAPLIEAVQEEPATLDIVTEPESPPQPRLPVEEMDDAAIAQEAISEMSAPLASPAPSPIPPAPKPRAAPRKKPRKTQEPVALPEGIEAVAPTPEPVVEAPQSVAAETGPEAATVSEQVSEVDPAPQAEPEGQVPSASLSETDAASAPAESQEDHPAPPADLYLLPGAGEGLVWMLGQCGVHSLQDLAECDPEELGQKLGLVGKILNVAPWVAFAKQTVR